MRQHEGGLLARDRRRRRKGRRPTALYNNWRRHGGRCWGEDHPAQPIAAPRCGVSTVVNSAAAWTAAHARACLRRAALRLPASDTMLMSFILGGSCSWVSGVGRCSS